MKHRSRILGLALLAVVGLMNLSGCSYLRNRFNDLKDVGDFGITLSTKPQFAVYASGPFIQCIACGGIGKVDGYFIGIGEGRASFLGPHYEKSLGLVVWGQEEVSFYHTEEELQAMPEDQRRKANNFMRVGALGFVHGPMPGLKYMGSCPHYIHLGWIGLSGGPRYMQMGDLALGLACIDICLDDNRDWDGRPPQDNKLKEGIGLRPSGIATYFSRIVHF